ncbi:MAG: class I adenylate-forming enzyme family protein [Actinomycetota bacterium]
MLASVVREAARRFGDRPAVVAPEGWALTYAELDRLSDEVAGGLVREGIGPGDVVALAMPSSPDYVVAYAAVAKVGAATCGVNPRLAPSERTKVLDLVRPDVVVGTDDLLEGLETNARQTGVRLGEDPPGVLDGLRGGAPEPSFTIDERSRPVAIVLTSGTTGASRGALFTGRQLEAIARIDGGNRWGDGGAMLASTELVHIGFMTKLPWYLRAGMTVHLLRPWRAGDALRIISEHRIRTVGAIAAQVALMLRERDFDRHDLSAVETLVVGGGPSPPALIREAKRRFGAGYSVRYSSTESGGIGTATEPNDDDEHTLSTVGRPREGVRIAVRDHDRDASPETVGEVWIRSPSVMTEYWRDPDATAATLIDGWLRTDDLGSLDGAGRLRLAGRRSETYIRGGYNVYPLEVESVLAGHPGVRAVAVVGRADRVMGEVGVAVVVPVDPAAPPSLEELRRFGSSRLARHKLPEDLRVVDEIPLNSIHKVDRRRLAADVAVAPVAPVASGRAG